MTPPKPPLLILGLETSCDETATAVVERRPDGKGFIHANLVRSQLREHAAFGGVVPEIAARAHVEVLDRLIEAAMAEAGGDIRHVTAVGGGARALWTRIVSDVTGHPQDVPRHTIGAAYGDAFLAAVGTGHAVAPDIAGWNPVEHMVEPDPATAGTYDGLYRLYRAVYFGLGTPDASPVALGHILPELRAIRAELFQQP